MRPHVCSLVIFQSLNFIMAASGSRAFAKKKKGLLCRLAGPMEENTTSRIPDPRAGFLIFCQWNLDFNLESTVVRGILNSLSFIPDSRAQGSSFHKQNFLDFRLNKNPNSLKWGDKYFK